MALVKRLFLSESQILHAYTEANSTSVAVGVTDASIMSVF